MLGPRLILWLFAALASAGAILSGLIAADRATSQQPPRLMFITSGAGPFWQQAIRGAQSAAGELSIDLEIATPSDDSLERQMAILRQLDAARLDGIALSPIAPMQQIETIDRLSRQTHVMTVGVDAPGSQRVSHVGAGGFAVGRLAANIVRDDAPNGGKVAILVDNAADPNEADASEGFHQAIHEQSPTASADWQVVDCRWDYQDPKSSAQRIREVLADHPGLVCFVALDSSDASTLVRVLREADRLKQTKVIVYDQSESTLAAIEAGEIHAAIAQDPYLLGYVAISRLAAICNYNSMGVPIPGKGSSFIPAEIVRQENVAEFVARLRSETRAPPS